MHKPFDSYSALMIHRLCSHGLDHVQDDDLACLADAYPELRQVFEEIQFFRRNAESETSDLQQPDHG